MTHEPFERSATLRLIATAFSDLADLLRKEIALASAEISERISATIRGAVLFAVAGVLAFIGVLIAAAGVVLVIASTGLALFWSCFIVAAALLILAGVLALVGKGSIGLTPHRSLRQVQKDISIAKEPAR